MGKMTEIFYDTEGDVLYRSIGKPRPAISQELGDDVLLRVDPDTGEVVGLTIMHLSSRFGSMQDPQVLPVEMALQRV